MDLANRIADVLRHSLDAEFIHIENDGGISGYVVSDRFERMSSLDRQKLLEQIFRGASSVLTPNDRKQILMIAALTPSEYEHSPHQIRIHAIRELGDGSLEFKLKGGITDAVYVQEVLSVLKDITFTEPAIPPGAPFLVTFVAKCTESDSLTKEKAIEVLANDEYIRLLLVSNSMT